MSNWIIWFAQSLQMFRLSMIVLIASVTYNEPKWNCFGLEHVHTFTDLVYMDI
jgi:hypothetical protein